MDGILVNSEPHHVIIEKSLLASLGLNISDEEHRSYLGKSSQQMWKEVREKHGLLQSAEELAGLNNDEIIKHFSGLSELELMPGVTDVLNKVRDLGIPMAVASSSDPGTIELMLTKTGLAGYFLYLVSCAIVGKSKPDPGVYIYTAGLLSVNPEECIVIEDSGNGIMAAKSAGMVCVEYNNNHTTNQVHPLADEYIDDYSKLPVILEKYLVL
jgi:HAD superfamily hydrolase (TIGR01509 family)